MRSRIPRRAAWLMWITACGGGGGATIDASGDASGGDAAGPASIVAVDAGGGAIASVSFDPTTVQESSTKTVYVRNDGGAATGAIALGASASFGIDSASTCINATLAAGATCTILATFDPIVTGPLSGELVIAAAPGGSLTVLLSGTGVVANLAVSPASIGLGSVDVGTSTGATVTVSNSGTGPGTLGAPSLIGTSWSIASTTCGATLAAHANCTIDLTVTAGALGDIASTLEITLDGTPTSVPLHAMGTSTLTVVMAAGSSPGTVTSAPTGIDCGSTCTAHFSDAVTLTATPAPNSAFGSWSEPSCTTAICTLPPSTAPRTVTATFVPATLYISPRSFSAGERGLGSFVRLNVQLENDTPASVSYTKSLTGADYAIDQDLCHGTVGAGAICQITIDFSPTAIGVRSADLDIVVNGVQNHVALSATGVTWATIAAVGNPPATTVTSDLPRLASCSTVCQAFSPTGTITFTAHPSAGVTLTGWSDPACGTNSTCTLSGTSSAITLRAYFAATATRPVAHVEPGPNIGYILEMQQAMQSFTVVNDTASDQTIDSLLIGDNSWGLSPGTCGATLAAFGSCTALGTFQPFGENEGIGAQLTATISGSAITVPLFAVSGAPIIAEVRGHGRVTSLDGIDCPGICDIINAGSDTLTETPDPGYVLQQWATDGDNGPCPVAPTCSVSGTYIGPSGRGTAVFIPQ